MHLHRATRRRACAWLAGVFLLMQSVLAAHACQPQGTLQAAGAAVMVAGHAGDCHGTQDAADAAWCQAHCSAEQPAPAQPAPSDAPVPALGGFVFLLPAVPVVMTGLPGGPTATACAASPPGWPPLYLTHGVLRN